MKRIIAISFFLTLIVALVDSCAGAGPVILATPNNSCYYTFVLDSKFNPLEKQTAIYAIDDWNSRVPELNYSLYIEPLSEHLPIKDRMIHIHCGYAADMDSHNSTLGTTFWYDSNPDLTGAEIYINITPDLPQTPTDVEYTRKVFAHEIGHAFALSHVPYDKQPYDIMNPIANIENHVTDGDVQRFYELHPSCKNNTNTMLDGGE